MFVTGDDPVKLGLVDSLNRPGGNVTGVSFILPALEAKRLELLHELLPKANLIAMLVNPSFASADLRVTAVREAASTLGLQLSMLNASSERDIDNAFAFLVEKQAGALIVTSDPFLSVAAIRLCSWQRGRQYRQSILLASSPPLVA